MKILLYCAFLIMTITGLNAHANNSIVVVANTQDKHINLSRNEIRNLFMGGVLSYDLTAVALPPENKTRVLFNTKVVGLTESRIQSYWAQMRFSGRKKPPKEINTEELMLEYLKSNQGTVGYLPAGTKIPDGLTVLFAIN